MFDIELECPQCARVVNSLKVGLCKSCYMKQYHKSERGIEVRNKYKQTDKYKQYCLENPKSDSYTKAQKKYLAKDSSKVRRSNYKLIRNYGITLADKQNMLFNQMGECAVDGCSNEAVCVDHNHTTGKVRELLCYGCNTAIGMIKESLEVASGIVEYIRRHTVGD